MDELDDDINLEESPPAPRGAEYDEAYWQSMDGGRGIQPSPMWSDISHIIFELFGVQDKEDISGSLKVIEFGCASGFLVDELRKRNFETFGLDISDYALENSLISVRQYLHKFDMAWVDDSHFGREKFDLAISFETLEHIPKEDILRALAHIYNSLKPHGKAVFTICTKDRPGWDVDPTHETIESRRWWEKRLRLLFVPLKSALGSIRKYYLFSSHPGVFVLQRRDSPLSEEPFDELGVELVRGHSSSRSIVRLEPISERDSESNAGGGEGITREGQTTGIGMDP